MRHLIAFRKLGLPTAHRKALLLTQCTQLIKHGRIMTTLSRAKELARVADKVVTLSKRESHVARVILRGMIKERECFQEVCEQFPARFAGRPGGYTRIIKL